MAITVVRGDDPYGRLGQSIGQAATIREQQVREQEAISRQAKVSAANHIMQQLAQGISADKAVQSAMATFGSDLTPSDASGIATVFSSKAYQDIADYNMGLKGLNLRNAQDQHKYIRAQMDYLKAKGVNDAKQLEIAEKSLKHQIEQAEYLAEVHAAERKEDVEWREKQHEFLRVTTAQKMFTDLMLGALGHNLQLEQIWAAGGGRGGGRSGGSTPQLDGAELYSYALKQSLVDRDNADELGLDGEQSAEATFQSYSDKSQFSSMPFEGSLEKDAFWRKAGRFGINLVGGLVKYVGGAGAGALLGASLASAKVVDAWSDLDPEEMRNFVDKDYESASEILWRKLKNAPERMEELGSIFDSAGRFLFGEPKKPHVSFANREAIRELGSIGALPGGMTQPEMAARGITALDLSDQATQQNLAARSAERMGGNIESVYGRLGAVNEAVGAGDYSRAEVLAPTRPQPPQQTRPRTSAEMAASVPAHRNVLDKNVSSH